MSTPSPEVEKRRPPSALRTWPLRRPRWDLGFLILVLIVGLAAPLIVSGLGIGGPLVRHPHAVNLFGNPTGPSGDHPLGVDGGGHDVLSQILYGLRSLALISLAGSALAAALSAGLAGLAGLDARLRWLRDALLEALSAYPALLLGLALGLSLSGVWRVIVLIALVDLVALSSPRQAPAALGVGLARSIGIDFGLTFIGVGPGGRTPQLGAMVAHAGAGIVAGVPAWWALLFPGLVVMIVLSAAQSLAWGLAPRLRPPMPTATPTRRIITSPLAGLVTAGLGRLVFAAVLAAVAFTALGGSNPGGVGPLAGLGQALGASGSLLFGGLVVWLGVTWLHLRLITRTPRGARTGPAIHGSAVPRWFRATPPALLSAAPTGWLAFLCLYAFSESVGKLAILPGPGAYVSLSRHPGAWAQSLVIPWLLLGLPAAAWAARAIARPEAQQAGAGQQRVARAAGVPERILARQRRRALWAPLLLIAARILPSFVGTALVIEVVYGLPGAGAHTVAAFRHGQAATVSDLTLLAGVVVVAAQFGLGVLWSLADPRAARR